MKRKLQIILSTTMAAILCGCMINGNQASSKQNVYNHNGIISVNIYNENRSGVLSYSTDLNGDGKEERVSIKVKKSDIDKSTRIVPIKINGKVLCKTKLTQCEMGFPVDLQIYDTGKQKLISVHQSGPNDWEMANNIYRYNGKKLIRIKFNFDKYANHGITRAISGKKQIEGFHITYPKKLTKNGKMRETYYTFELKKNKLILVDKKSKVVPAAG